MGASSPRGAEAIAFYGLLVAMAVLVRKGRRDPEASTLDKGQRIRPVLLEVLDPLLTVVLVGPLVVHLLEPGGLRLLAAGLGVAVAVPIGLLRAKVMWVRAIPKRSSVVLARSAAEYALVGLLVLLRLAEERVRHVHSPVANLALSALVVAALVETFVRAGGILLRYQRARTSGTERGITDAGGELPGVS